MAIEIIDTLSQKNGGSFPLVDSNDIKGGYYQVDTIKERDAIPSTRRKEGMLCYVKNDKIYCLSNGITNDNWIEFKVGSDFDGDYESLTNKPNIPTKTSDLVNDSGFITNADLDTSQNHIHGNLSTLEKITEEKITSWDNKSDFDGDYNSLTNKPEIPTVDVNKEYVDSELGKKADKEHTHKEYAEKDNTYDREEIEGFLSELADTLNQKIDNIVYTDDNFLNFYANEVLIKSIKIEGGSQVDSVEIDELKNEKIDDVQISTENGITYINLFANNTLIKSIEIKTGGEGLISVGADEPTSENCEVWIDVSDDEEFSSKIEDALVDEIKFIIGNLQEEINTLKKIIVAHEARIEYLELNGDGSSGGEGDSGDNDSPTTKFIPLTFEGGEVLILEDETILTFEDLNY